MTLDVAFLGLGKMGRPMAANIIAAGHRVVLWNRTAAHAEDLVARGPGEASASVAETPAEAVANAGVVVSMLADEDAVFSVYEGERGVAAGIRPGAVAVEMSTICPDAVWKLASVLDTCGAGLIDAPVSGSVATAKAGELTIMTGGSDLHLKAVMPVLDCMGARIFPMGPVGTGAAMKLAVNTIVLALNGAVSEGLVLAEAAGIERRDAYRVFAASAIAAPFVHYRRTAFESPEAVPPAFAMTLGEKDLTLILELASRVGVELPQAMTNRAVLARAIEAGFGDHDVSGAAEFLRTLRTRVASDGEVTDQVTSTTTGEDR